MTETRLDIGPVAPAGPAPEPDRAPGSARDQRWIDHVPRGAVVAATACGFAVPVVAYLVGIDVFGVDVIYNDQLSVAPFLAASRTHLIPWGALWAQYNQDRSFFPNLLVVALAHLDHFDVRTEDLLGGLMLIAATALLIAAHKRRSPDCPWLYYCPVPLATLSLVQYSNTFFGGVSWNLTLLGLAGALLLLDAPRHRLPALAGAVACAVVGTLSSAAGLFIWPAGLALLALRRQGWRDAAAWTACALVTAAGYFHGFTFDAASSPQSGLVGSHPGTALGIFLTVCGNMFGLVVPPGRGADPTVLLLGAAVLGVSLWSVARNLRRPAEDGGPIGVALIVFALLFALSVAAGRIEFGESGASISRYTTYSLLLLVGSYFGFLGVRRAPEAAPGRRWRAPAALGTSAVLALIALQVWSGSVNGLRGARGFHDTQVLSAAYEREYRTAPDYMLELMLGPFRSAAWIRSNVAVADAMHLSVFSGPPPGRGGPLDLPPPQTGFLLPRDGASVHGAVVVDAATRSDIGVSTVTLVVSGGPAAARVVLPLRLGIYGWTARWDSTRVPDGSYEAVATTRMFDGASTTSPVLRLQVANS